MESCPWPFILPAYVLTYGKSASYKEETGLRGPGLKAMWFLRTEQDSGPSAMLPPVSVFSAQAPDKSTDNLGCYPPACMC